MKYKDPPCYRSNDRRGYPLCLGSLDPEEFKNLKCNKCNLYEDMDEEDYDENQTMIGFRIP